MSANSVSENWYAVYTASRAEKKVKERLDLLGIANYLPLKWVERRWSDRVKRLEVPLINGYIFVRVTPRQFRAVYTASGVVAFLKEFGVPAPIPDRQIHSLRHMNDYAEEEVEVLQEEIPRGSYIRVVRGHLAGIEGELVDYRGKSRLLVRLNHLGCAMTAIPASCVEKYDPPKQPVRKKRTGLSGRPNVNHADKK